MEILDLIAKVSWDTNESELLGVNKAMQSQDKLLNELREKGKRLNDQLVKTNDPKKVKALNDELQKTFKSVNNITEAQKKQGAAVDALRKKQIELVKELQKTSDPKLVQGLLRNLVKVENQLDALGAKAKTLPSKFAGIGQSLLQGVGIGGGMMALQTAINAISNFVGGAIDEAKDAQRTALELERSLKTIGKGQYFEGLVNEADALATAFRGVYDNDDIIKAQSALISYGKVTRAELSQLLPIIMELASAENIDLAQATDKIIGIMEGRGGATLRQYGLSVKDLKTEHDRLNLVLGEFATKLKGSTEAFAESAAGQDRILETSIKNQQEQIGNKLLPLWGAFLTGINNSLNALGKLPDILDNLFTPESIQRMDRYTAQLNALRGGAKAGGAGSVLSGALNPNATSLEDSEADATRKKAADELAKKRKEEALKAAKEKKDLQKQIQESAKKNEIQNEKDLSERPDVTNALAQIKANQDRLVEIEREQLSEPLIKAAQDAARRRAKAEVDAESEVKRKAREEQRQAERQELASSFSYFASEINQILALDEARTSRQIELQQDRVDAAKNSSEASLRVEQNRLDELVRKRERYERAQRAIDATVIVANQAVAISGAVRTIASGGNPVLIAANVLAILAGIAASVTAIRSINADSGFKEGGYTGDGDPSEVSTKVGRRSYKYHNKEFVMNEELTSKNRDMFEEMHRGRLVAKRIGNGYYLMPPEIDTDKAIADHYTVREQLNTSSLEGLLSSIDIKLAAREVNVHNNFDADGFSTKIATQLGRISIIDKMRNS